MRGAASSRLTVEPWHQTPWDWRATLQFICGGTGTGLLLFMALAAQLEIGWPVWSVLPALAFVGLGLISVFIKLGRRGRAAFVVLNPFTSWMAREALIAPPMLGLGFLAVVLNHPAWALVAAAFGLGFLYAQARILKEARGIPIWREPLIVPLMASTGLTEGAALLLVAASSRLTAAAFFGVPPTDGDYLRVGGWAPAALVFLLAVRLGVWTLYRRKLAMPGAAPVRSVEVLTECSRLLVPAGHALPLLAALGTLIFPGGAVMLGVIAGLTALLGGWYLKFTLIARAAFNQGFALVRTPARTPGYAGPGVKPGWAGWEASREDPRNDAASSRPTVEGTDANADTSIPPSRSSEQSDPLHPSNPCQVVPKG